MNVRVDMHGVLGRADNGQAASFSLAMHDGVTARELVRKLAERCGTPFSEAIESSDSRFPRHIRMFCDGEMLMTLEQPLVTTCRPTASVNVVVLSPMMGG